MSDFQSTEVVLVCSDLAEAQAIFDRLREFSDDHGEVAFEDLEMNTEVGALKTKKIISFVVGFSTGVTSGVVGNAVYDALKSSTTVQCIVGGHSVKSDDKAKLDAAAHAHAKPHKAKKHEDGSAG